MDVGGRVTVRVELREAVEVGVMVGAGVLVAEGGEAEMVQVGVREAVPVRLTPALSDGVGGVAV